MKSGLAFFSKWQLHLKIFKNEISRTCVIKPNQINTYHKHHEWIASRKMKGIVCIGRRKIISLRIKAGKLLFYKTQRRTIIILGPFDLDLDLGIFEISNFFVTWSLSFLFMSNQLVALELSGKVMEKYRTIACSIFDFCNHLMLEYVSETHVKQYFRES